jgi:hypothetical protein
LKLADKLRTFTYDPSSSYRGWLRRLTQHAWSDFSEGRRKPGAGSGDTGVFAMLETIEAKEDLVKRMDEAFDRELLDQDTSPPHSKAP